MASDEPNDRQRQEHLWMVALYELEERTGELLDRLGALGIDTDEATIVRVELDDGATVAELKAFTSASAQRSSSLPAVARYAITGAIIGSSILLLVGVGLYETSILNLGIISGLFGHALVSALCGAVVGALLGTVAASVLSRSAPRPDVPDWARLNRDGFLVAIKMPPGLAEQAEEIARRLGAKEILL